MEIQIIKDNLKELELKKRYLICKYHNAYEVNDFIQVVLSIICDEPEYVESNKLNFDYYSRESVAYVKAESFTDFIRRDCNESLYLKPLLEQIDFLETYLEDKLIKFKLFI